jgi:hypothetical protein
MSRITLPLDHFNYRLALLAEHAAKLACKPGLNPFHLRGLGLPLGRAGLASTSAIHRNHNASAVYIFLCHPEVTREHGRRAA